MPMGADALAAASSKDDWWAKHEPQTSKAPAP
jgi:hypothetical protein